MKKLFTLAILISVFTISSNCYSQSIMVGLEAGVNIANVNLTPSLSTDSKTGLILGGVIEIGISPNISAVSGIRYVMKGYKFTSGATTSSQRLDYLEFPALLKIKLPLTEIKPYAILGPTLGILLTAESKVENAQSSQTTDNKGNFETSDLGLLFGVGLDFKMATKTILFFEAAYSLGLSNVNKVPNTSTTKNYGVQVIVGGKFIL